MGGFKLKNNMKLGVICAAAQASGGTNHTWNEWYRRSKTRGVMDSTVGAQHAKNWRQDVMLMRRMGIETCRLGVEWATVEPQEGVFNERELERLKEEILLMCGLGIIPMLTLHHFTNPLWFEAAGGWQDPDNIRYFIRYAEKVVGRVGHLVNEYITINEPNLYAYHGFYAGDWPPGKKSINSALSVMNVMAAAHIRCYKLIHNLRRNLGFSNTRVSCSVHMRAFKPKRGNPIENSLCQTAERLFQKRLIEAINTGKFPSSVKNHTGVRSGQYCDFHALSYNARSTLVGLKPVNGGGFRDDLGSEIYPDGIIRCAWDMMDVCSLPVYIAENGVCDKTDAFRARYIYDHLEALCRSELPVKRYYYRSFLDGFEWLAGYNARFGLVRTNFTSMERMVKNSGQFYSQIISDRGVSEESFKKYVAGQEYHR